MKVKVYERISRFGWIKFFLITMILAIILVSASFGVAIGMTVLAFIIVAFILVFGLSAFLSVLRDLIKS